MKDIPREVMELCFEAQHRLGIGEQDLYSLDFAYCSKDQRRYLIEMNSAPGIWFPPEDKQFQLDFFQEVADYFHYLIDSHRFHKFEEALGYNPGVYAFMEGHTQTSLHQE